MNVDKKTLFNNRIKDISIDSPQTYQAVALFVDKPNYIKWMLQEREKLGIQKPYQDVEMPLWQWQLDNQENKVKMEMLRNDALGISKKLRASIVMVGYIIQTVFNGKIWHEQKIIDFIGPEVKFHEKRRVIVPDFTTTVEDVLDAFKTIKKEYEEYGRTLGLVNHSRYKRDHFNNYRNWYWLRTMGVSSKSIAKRHNKNTNHEVTPENIETGIKAYRKWLKE